MISSACVMRLPNSVAELNGAFRKVVVNRASPARKASVATRVPFAVPAVTPEYHARDQMPNMQSFDDSELCMYCSELFDYN